MKKVYLIAAVAAILSGVLLFFYLKNFEKSTRVEVIAEETVTVVVPVVEIPACTEITADMLTTLKVSKSSAPENAFHDLEECVGTYYDGTLHPEQVLLKSMLSSLAEAAPSLSYTVPEGMRAMTINVNVSTGVAGYIIVGDHIDLLTNRISANQVTGEINEYTRIVGDNILVLAAGDTTTELPAVYTTLTLALTPAQCREVYAAQALCDYEGVACVFTALLRNPRDTEPLAHTTEKVTDIPGKAG